MRQRKSHIAPLAFLMLILIVSPMIVKAVHHHLPIQISVPAELQGKSISAAVGACPVCQFEFVTFIAFGNQEYTHFSLISSLDYCEPTHGLKGNSCTYYSLRAPPAI
jgi:hypothetical protein